MRPFTKPPLGEPVIQVNQTRVIEGLIIAVLSAGLSVFGTNWSVTSTLRVEFAGMKERVDQLAKDARESNTASSSDRADIVRLQAQMAGTQQQIAATQQQITEFARTSNERLTILERGMFGAPPQKR